MANQNRGDRAYGLTTLCPILNGSTDTSTHEELGNQSYAACVRDRLQTLRVHEDSPFAKVPNTYLCRLYVLPDVFYQGKPAIYENLKSKYLVFTSNFHGDLDEYLAGMWDNAEHDIKSIWEYCVAFDKVDSTSDWVKYIKRCQVKTTLFFNGSTDDPLDEQLKSLYLKQEFSDFVFENQGRKPKDIQTAFAEFVKRTQPANLASPSWRQGASSLKNAVTTK